MPLTQLDNTPALVVIDLQKAVTRLPTVHPVGEAVAQSAKLARAFREHHLPVVLVNVTGFAPGRTDSARPAIQLPPDWSELAPELERQPTDHIVSKQRWGAFHGTALDAILRQHGVTQIVLSGVATSIGVESAARSSYDCGYNVVLVLDAMTDLDAGAHRRAVEKIFPRLGETTTTQQVLKLPQQRADQ